MAHTAPPRDFAQTIHSLGVMLVPLLRGIDYKRVRRVLVRKVLIANENWLFLFLISLFNCSGVKVTAMQMLCLLV